MKSLTLFSWLLGLTVAVSSLPEDNFLTTQHIVTNNYGVQSRPYKIIIELQKKGTFIRHCGAAQLTEQWYLTAAECVERINFNSMRILEFDDSHNVKRVSKIWLDKKIHPEYNEETKDNNIALLKGYSYGMPNNLPGLPSKDQSEALLRKSAVIFGWANWPKAKSLTMKNLVTTVVNGFWCKMAYPLLFKTEQHLCTFSFRGNDVSQDDVGAPLVISHSDNVSELIGIATDIRPFTNVLPMPMVFTNIAPYVEWIQNETNGTTTL